MATSTRKDRLAAIAYAKKSVLPDQHRIPADAHDYGDQDTVGLHMKRNTFDIGDVAADDVFGLYLGKHPDGYVIMVTDVFSRPTGAEVFETLEEMKAEWRLD
jgi:hypothetical protein